MHRVTVALKLRCVGSALGIRDSLLHGVGWHAADLARSLMPFPDYRRCAFHLP